MSVSTRRRLHLIFRLSLCQAKADMRQSACRYHPTLVFHAVQTLDGDVCRSPCFTLTASRTSCYDETVIHLFKTEFLAVKGCVTRIDKSTFWNSLRRPLITDFEDEENEIGHQRPLGFRIKTNSFK